MTWQAYFEELGGVAFSYRALLLCILGDFSDEQAQFEIWKNDFENEGVLATYHRQEQDALEQIGVTEELFEWLYNQNRYQQEPKPPLDCEASEYYLTFSLAPEVIKEFWTWSDFELEKQHNPYLPGITE